MILVGNIYEMSKICFTADQHIKLGQKNVPRDWQYKRFMLLAAELNKVECDYHVFGGDLLDVAKPSVDELGTMYTFLSRIVKPIILISGNHEMQTKSRDCYVYLSDMLQDLKVTIVRDFRTIDGIDYIPYNILHSKEWGPRGSNIAVTHVRGAIPPHVEPEVDLERFKHYEKVFAGDLHSVTNSQGNILYPGSPFSTSFHRSVPAGANGFFLIDSDTGSHSWTELHLPQLLRKTVRNAADMEATEFHHTIYELEGSMEELALVANSELLDKKVTTDISAPATLNMTGNMAEELAEFLINVKELPTDVVSSYITLFKETVIDSD